MNNTDSVLLRPGTNIRPLIHYEKVETLLKEYYDLNDVNIVELNGYDDKNYHIQVKSDAHCPEGYVFKVINALDSSNYAVFEAQTSLLLHLGKVFPLFCFIY